MSNILASTEIFSSSEGIGHARPAIAFGGICWILPIIEERIMRDDIRLIQNKIAALRKEMRTTLDRTKQPAILTQIMKEIGKLKAVYGVRE